MSKNWIQGAIGKKGQLHRDLGVPEGEKIPQEKLDAAMAGKFGPKVKQRAELAHTLRGMHAKHSKKSPEQKMAASINNKRKAGMNAGTAVAMAKKGY